MDAIDHLDLVVTSMEQSLPFYRGLLNLLGYVHGGDITGERGERVAYLSRHGGGGSVGLRQAQPDGGLRRYDRYAIGVHHVAFSASRRQVVDMAAGWAREHDAVIESEPREYDYTPGYYAAFIHDPDGLKLEIVHRPSERDLTRRVRELETLVQGMIEGRAAPGSAG
jgi:glyoxylase I family protein